MPPPPQQGDSPSNEQEKSDKYLGDAKSPQKYRQAHPLWILARLPLASGVLTFLCCARLSRNKQQGSTHKDHLPGHPRQLLTDQKQSLAAAQLRNLPQGPLAQAASTQVISVNG